MPHIDQVTAIIEVQSTTNLDFKAIGAIPVFMGNYPASTKIKCVAVIGKTGAGDGILRVWDYVGSQSLGTVNFDSDDTLVQFELTGLPTLIDGVGYLLFEIMSVSEGTTSVIGCLLVFS